MKKVTLALTIAAVMLTMVVWSSAAGGATDPLASLSYLKEIYLEKVEEAVEERLDDSDENLLDSISRGESIMNSVPTWTERRLKCGDILSGVTGTNVLLLAGDMQVTYEQGAVVDVTAGAVIPSGSKLVAQHRYLVAEDAAAEFSVVGKTAVVDYQGPYSFGYSSATDYNAMASALKTMHLFKGSFTGYGEGFDLEVQPTRLQALIMFIRVLGEEEQALAWSGTMPFDDIQPGSQAERYVGYAYSKGYTNGYTKTQFRPSQPVNVYQYTEFILRAMGYSSAENTNLSDTLIRAYEAGVLKADEVNRLQKETFLRADLVYTSYYALEATMPDSIETLGDTLIAKGVFTAKEWSTARKMVTSKRG